MAAEEGGDLHDVRNLPAASHRANVSKNSRGQRRLKMKMLARRKKYKTKHSPDGLRLEAFVDVRHDGDVEGGLDGLKNLS